MDWLSGVLNAIKLPVKIICVIALFTLMLLIMPTKILTLLSLNLFTTQYKQYISLVFIGSVAYLLVNIISYIVSILRYNNRTNSKKIRKIIDTKIESLDPHEKAVLREFFIQAKNTIKLLMDNPIVAGLLENHIIEQVGKMGQNTLFGLLINFKISDYAYTKITPQLIEVPDREPTEIERREIISKRPEFMKKLSMFSELL